MGRETGTGEANSTNMHVSAKFLNSSVLPPAFATTGNSCVPDRGRWNAKSAIKRRNFTMAFWSGAFVHLALFCYTERAIQK